MHGDAFALQVRDLGREQGETASERRDITGEVGQPMFEGRPSCWNQVHSGPAVDSSNGGRGLPRNLAWSGRVMPLDAAHVAPNDA
jgi:hypothetical protein